ncbi:hypothetical protein [Paucisalibacillus globulus]|uniref:hypothetical protein n=1 Tax=Paucisalibacillus globulus TaxID=351095 RepID=UPI0003FF8425|nr:hypothetical protein [Paucisalibacillus globulus]
MEHDFDRLRCPLCTRIYKMMYPVFLDELNTVVHQRCYSPYKINSIKDRGTYQEIMERYSFFNELAPKESS